MKLVNKLFYIFCLFNALNSFGQTEDWISLFNGKNLNGWLPKIKGYPLGENYKNTFSVSNDCILVDYSGYESFDGRFGHLYSEQSYSHYRIQLEYKFIGNQVKGAPSWAGQNSGIMLHCQSPQSVELKQDFPVSLEFQFLYGNTDNIVHTGNLCSPGTKVFINGREHPDHVVESNSRPGLKDQWVKAEAVVLGDSIIHHIINEDTVITYTNLKYDDKFVNNQYNWKSAGITDSLTWTSKRNMPLSHGHIALQAESQPILFRKIKLLNLKGCMDKEAKNFRPYFVIADNNNCKY